MDANGLGFMNYETGGEFHVEDWANHSFYLNAERFLEYVYFRLISSCCRAPDYSAES